jgi:hypothetical protein
MEIVILVKVPIGGVMDLVMRGIGFLVQCTEKELLFLLMGILILELGKWE